jgi:hypothetical protein
LIVKTYGRDYITPERIMAEKVGEIPQRFILHNLPIEGGYDQISVEVKDIISRGESLPFSSAVISFSPTHEALLNDTFKEKWGRIWNIQLCDRH